MVPVDDDANRDLADHGAALADAVIAAVPAWVERAVVSVAGPRLTDEAAAAGERAVAELAPRLRALLAADVDEQRANPLMLVREVARYPTEVLRAAGVPARPRASFEEEHFPGDEYGLVPMTWRDVDESLHEPGLVWGALKARAHLARHRSEHQ
jgi:hypothetical protein